MKKIFWTIIIIILAVGGLHLINQSMMITYPVKFCDSITYQTGDPDFIGCTKSDLSPIYEEVFKKSYTRNNNFPYEDNAVNLANEFKREKEQLGFICERLTRYYFDSNGNKEKNSGYSVKYEATLCMCPQGIGQCDGSGSWNVEDPLDWLKKLISDIVEWFKSILGV
jgi:hypothetical protein